MNKGSRNRDLIVKDNKLITSKYHLTLMQIKFISFMGSRINKDDEDFFTYSFQINDILNVLDVKRVHYKQLRVSLRELMSKYIVLEDNQYNIKETTFLSFFHIDKENDMIQMRFDKSLKPFLLQLNRKFTKLSLAKILRFNSQYTIRMYEIIESKINIYDKYKNRYLLEFEYKIEELKEIMVGDYDYKSEQIQIPKAYSKYNNFKRKVIDTAYVELKKKGEYYFEYEPIKTGRKITKIKFIIHKNAEKIKEDTKEKRRQYLLKGEEKQLVAEQIKRMLARQGDKIRDKLKYEQKMMQLYFQGKLKYDKDLQEIKDEMDRVALEKMFEF
jgi:plasmid replication initiation protein